MVEAAFQSSSVFSPCSPGNFDDDDDDDDVGDDDDADADIIKCFPAQPSFDQWTSDATQPPPAAMIFLAALYLPWLPTHRLTDCSGFRAFQAKPDKTCLTYLPHIPS